MSVPQMVPQMPTQQPGMPMQYTGQQPQACWVPPIQNMQVNQLLVQNTDQGMAQNNGPAWASGRPLIQQGPSQGHLQVQPMQQFAPLIHQPPMQQQYQSQAIPPQPQMQMMPQMQQLQQQGQPQQLQYATAPELPMGAARPPQAPSRGGKRKLQAKPCDDAIKPHRTNPPIIRSKLRRDRPAPTQLRLQPTQRLTQAPGLGINNLDQPQPAASTQPTEEEEGDEEADLLV